MKTLDVDIAKGAVIRMLALTFGIVSPVGSLVAPVMAAQAPVRAIGRAQTEPMGGYYRLQLKHGGKYLDAKYCGDTLNMNPGSTHEDGACQLWRMVPSDGGWFRLQLRHGGQYLDAKYCGDTLNMNPGSTHEDGACQLWRFVPIGDGWFRLQLKHGGKYLDAEYCGDNVSMNPGSDWEGGACQAWRLVPQSASQVASQSPELPASKSPGPSATGTIAPVRPTVDRATQWRCERYARISLEQFRDSRELQCNLGGPRWEGSRDSLYAWCIRQPENGIYAQQDARRNELEQCQESKKVPIDPD